MYSIYCPAGIYITVSYLGYTPLHTHTVQCILFIAQQVYTLLSHTWDIYTHTVYSIYCPAGLYITVSYLGYIHTQCILFIAQQVYTLLSHTWDIYTHTVYSIYCPAGLYITVSYLGYMHTQCILFIAQQVYTLLSHTWDIYTHTVYSIYCPVVIHYCLIPGIYSITKYRHSES